MIRTLSLACVVSLGLAATGAEAKTCRDAAGHFAKCETAAAAKDCRDAAGKFIKCPSTAAASAPAARATASNNGGLLDMLRRKPAPAAAPAARSATAAGRPTAATVAGAVTARCRDGTLSHSQHRSGTCAGHGGVASWM